MLIGHSLGADAVMEMAAYLGRKGVPVALVVPFDGTKSFAASDNVGRVLNLTQRDYAYMRGGPGFHGALDNVDAPRLHKAVVAEVLAVVGNHKAASAKNGNGADAGTLGSRAARDKTPIIPRHLRTSHRPVRNHFTLKR